MSTLTGGPGCPDCEADNENPIQAYMYDEHDNTKIVGYEVRCKECGMVWDEWLYHEYGIVR
jgi:uncharacterized Zn finger protein